MLSMKPLIDKKKEVDEPLTTEEKEALLNHNKDKNYSYYCLLKEYLTVTPNITPRDLIKGYSGVTLFEIG